MALHYQVTAIKLRASLADNRLTFLGQVGVQIDTPTDGVTVADPVQGLILRDLATGRAILPSGTRFIDLTYAPDGGNAFQRTGFLEIAQTAPGTMPGQQQFDLYLLRFSGAPLPLPRPGADFLAFRATIRAEERDLADRPFLIADGPAFDLDALDDILTRTGTDEGPKEVAPEPEPLPDPDRPAPQGEIVRGAADDRITGTPDNTLILAGAGNDRVTDAVGANEIYGADGDDTILTGAGDDLINGGRGADVLSGGDGDDFLDGFDGDDRLSGGPGADLLFGGPGADVIRSGGGGGFAAGGDGADILLGFSGDETLLGGAGDDVLSGGTGADTLGGGAGADRLTGGPGRDVFVFRDGLGTDRVLDFTDRSDRLDFVNHAQVRDLADLRLTAVGGSVVIDDGAGGRIVLVGVDLADLSAADFLF